jgi:predicted phage terminase large subunit-like protein
MQKMETTMPPREDKRAFRFFLHICAETLDGSKLAGDRYLDFFCVAATQVVAKKADRLIVNVPPRHLKTVTISIALAAWELAHRPSTRILVVCHSDALARYIASAIRKILDAPWYRKEFATRVAKGEDRRGDFQTVQGGGLFAISTFGGITGWGGDLIIIDDTSDIDDARSPEKLAAVNERFNSTIRGRLNNPETGRIVVVQHRLHPNDLSGHLLDQGGWTHLALPLLAEEDTVIEFFDEVWHRPAGTLLRQGAFSPREVEQLRRSSSIPGFDALYQQRPSGLAFKIGPQNFPLFRTIPDQAGGVVLSIDTASGVDPRSSWSALLAFRTDGQNHYLIDVRRFKVDYRDLIQKAVAMVRRHNPSLALVEEAGCGYGLADHLERRAGTRTVTVSPGQMSKIERLRKVADLILAGRVLVPQGGEWVDQFLAEITTFPFGGFDDQVDALTQYLGWWQRSPTVFDRKERPLGSYATTRGGMVRLWKPIR